MRNKTFIIVALVVFAAGIAFIVGAGEKGTTAAQPAQKTKADAPAQAAADPKTDTQATAASGAQTTTAAEAAAQTAASVIAEQLPTYPLLVCPVSGKKLGSMGDPVSFVHEGRLVRFCCTGCEDKFLKNPATYFATIDSAVIGTQIASYPLEECPVSGEALGSMGEPYNHVHGTRLVRFCCDGCLKDFAKDPATYLAKIDAAVPVAAEAD